MKFPSFDTWVRSRPERAHVGIRREWRIEGHEKINKGGGCFWSKRLSGKTGKGYV